MILREVETDFSYQCQLCTPGPNSLSQVQVFRVRQHNMEWCSFVFGQRFSVYKDSFQSILVYSVHLITLQYEIYL